MVRSFVAILGVIAACSSQSPTKTTTISNDGVKPPEPAAPTGNDRVAEVLVTEVGTCARMVDGGVRCWGAGEEGETLVPKPVAGVSGAVQLFGVQSGQCARRSDGRVQCWGSLDYIVRGTEKGAYFVDALANANNVWMGARDGCAKLATKTICWGIHSGGLANGGAQRMAPTIPQLRDAIEFGLETHHGCALLKDATVTCWGENDNGQLGDGTTKDRATPAVVPNLRDVAQIAVGEASVCARLADGTVSCWGANTDGQLGDDTKSSSTPKRVANVTEVTQLAAGKYHVCALHRDRTVTCWGQNQSGQLGREGTGGLPEKVAGLADVTQLSASRQHTCAVHGNGTLSCWGANYFGLLGDGTQINRAKPVAVKWRVEQRTSAGLPPGVSIRAVAAGVDHTCAVLDDGTVRCWGGNEDGQLTGTKSEPLPTPTPVPTIAKAASIKLGTMTTTVTREDHTTIGWGRNRKGFQPDPKEDSLCARASDGTVTCAHETSREQLRDTTALVGNEYFACALMKNRTVQCTGSNYAGQLGDGKTTNRQKFAPVPKVTDVVQIVGGNSHTCVRKADHTVMCWGGDSTRMMNAPSPRAVSGLADAEELFSGPNGACARRTSGAVACWWWYAVPFASTTFDPDRIVLEPVAWLQGARLIAFAESHGCAAIGTELVCWGDNTRGQLGDGTYERRDKGVPVRW